MTAVSSPAAPAGTVAAVDAPAAPAAPAAPVRRPRLPAGQSAIRFDTLEAAKSAPKPSDKHTVHKVVRSEVLANALGKPREVFYLSNHRNSVNGAILKEDGYEITNPDSTRLSADPVKRAEKAREIIESLSDEDRQKLFARYMAGGNVTAAAALPAAPPRVDTSSAAEFDAPAKSGNGDAKTAAGAHKPAPAAPARKR